MLNFIYENNAVCIDADFIKNEMKDINGEFVKVYLYAMYAVQNNIDITYSDIAAKLGLLESEVRKAFDLFFEKGILKEKEKPVIINSENKKPIIINEKIKKASNEEMSQFCIVAEATINRPLNSKEIDTLYWIYNSLSLAPEVILMAIEYCMGEGKSDIKSIEKLAIKWDRDGITTIPQAEKFFKEQYKKKEIIKKIAEKFSIKDMDSQAEAFLISWYFDMNIDEDVIEFAFECCQNQINDISFNYINTILKNWQNEKVKTVEDAKRHNEKFRSRHKKTNNVSTDNGEYDDLADLTQK